MTHTKTVYAFTLKPGQILHPPDAEILEAAPWAEYVTLSIRYRSSGRLSRVTWPRDSRVQIVAPARPSLQPCVACGRPSTARWCSTSCHVSEDLLGDPGNY